MSSEFGRQLDDAEHEWRTGFERGPTRTRWTVLPVQVGDPAPDVTLQDHMGNSRTLSEFWTGDPALILFWRQFGCGCGVERAARLKEEIAAYVDAGASVVIVGQGEPVRAAAYVKEHGISCPILCDVELKTYVDYGLLEGIPTQVFYDASPELIRRDPEAGAELAETRHQSGRPLVDNGWQLPGEFIVDSDGVIQLAYRYQYCEDFPDPRVHTTTLREIARHQSES
ncbi:MULTISPECIES: peroxiredoxin-like family protein [unclassified Haladaptatus]|uniref:peroxiredoxin-like family protein n=1 Tax=unclassified Haladaptatus TaxID=2622732 RepID=UPI0023E7E80E|nr:MULTISPECIES: peroxiredoxin-like family protein [unclassified Haladaptatus]